MCKVKCSLKFEKQKKNEFNVPVFGSNFTILDIF